MPDQKERRCPINPGEGLPAISRFGQRASETQRLVDQPQAEADEVIASVDADKVAIRTVQTNSIGTLTPTVVRRVFTLSASSFDDVREAMNRRPVAVILFAAVRRKPPAIASGAWLRGAGALRCWNRDQNIQPGCTP
jgi:hypothetical protein